MGTLEQSILTFIKKIDPARNQDFIAGQNPKLDTYKAWYNGQNAWHNRKTIQNGEQVVVQLEASGCPKLIAEDWASNYANEDTAINVAVKKEDKDNITNEVITQILQNNRFFARFNPFAEKFNALGCGATVVLPKKFTFSEEKLIKNSTNKVKIYFLDADRVIPVTTEDGEVTECAFVRTTTNETILQVHILVDGKYKIGEVRGKNPSQGKMAETFNYEQAIVINTNSEIPLFQVWMPNISGTENICESIYEQAIGWFKLVDTIFDCWYKEFKRGAKKRFISAEMQDIDSDGQKVDMHDMLEDEDIAVPLGADGKTYINEFNAELRVDPILKALVSAMNVAARLCGLGDSAFEIGDSGGRPIQTATAAILKESKLYKNIIKQENFATSRIKALLLAIKEVYNNYISDATLDFEEDDITVVYDDNIMEDTQQKKENEIKDVQLGALTLAEFRSHWYDDDLETAKKFIYDNAMLIDKYTLALQAHVITPEMFVDLTFGKKCEYKKELVAYITSNQVQPSTGFEDESDNEDADAEDEEPKEKEDKDDE